MPAGGGGAAWVHAFLFNGKGNVYRTGAELQMGTRTRTQLRQSIHCMSRICHPYF